jgi:hypothetical protein
MVMPRSQRPPRSGMVRAGFDAIWAWLAGTGNGISR